MPGTSASGVEVSTRHGALHHAPTVKEIISDQLTRISLEYWAVGSTLTRKPFDANIIEDIYSKELTQRRAAKIMLLELSNYLENYLWPNFDANSSSFAHVMSIMVMVNEKFRENVRAWDCFTEHEKFHGFFRRVLDLRTSHKLTSSERTIYILFLINSFQSLENELLRNECQRLVFIPLWSALNPNRLEKELRTLPKLRQKWNALQKKWAKDEAQDSAPPPSKASSGEEKAQVASKGEEEEEEEEEAEEEVVGKKRKKSGGKKAGKKKSSKKAAKQKKKSKSAKEPTDVETEQSTPTSSKTAPSSSDESLKRRDRYHERTFLPSLLTEFLDVLSSIDEEKAATDADLITYCDRFVEFATDLEAQLPTRRFFHALLEDSHFVIRTQQSLLYQSIPQGYLFRQLVEILKFYQGFEVNNYSGQSLTDEEMEKIHFDRIEKLQHLAFVHFRDQLEDFALAPVSAVESKEDMTRFLSRLDDSSLHRLCELLALLPSETSTKHSFHFNTMKDQNVSSKFMMEIITSTYQRRRSQIQVINNTPLFPTEALLWNEGVIPSGNYTGETPLALPKLNLQFLTFFDYLWRNYNLFRLESASEIKDDIEDVVRRSAPRQSPSGNGRTEFTGWARMGIPIKEFKIVHVAKPDLGEKKPSRVKAEIVINLSNVRGNIRGEWEELRTHDVLFLISVRSPLQLGDKVDTSKPFPKQFGVEHVRGCEIIDINDETGHSATEEEKAPVFGFGPVKRHRTGDKRIIRVLLDANQYQADIDAREANPSMPEIYTSFNLLMRRKPKENNFKSVLETIRELMNTRETVPEWLHDVFLGYGNPASARNVTSLKSVDFVDTFLDSQHVKDCYPDKKVIVAAKEGFEAKPPFRLTFNEGLEEVTAEAYVPPNPGPYPYDKPKQNHIRFTPTQVSAIQSGMNEGMTLIVGPPGTGKTDVAVQIISNWYHNFPNQRILLVTHSNQALNQLFDKIAALDVDERHLLRLGHGQETLETEGDFSKTGRVNHMLKRRLFLLVEIGRMAKALSVTEDVHYTCETAIIFFQQQVVPRWEEFKRKIDASEKDSIVENFPFIDFFSNAPQPLFKGNSFEEDREVAEGCWRHLNKLFAELEDCRAFELLLTSKDRGNYLLTKQARIVALTCTHAAMRRRELLSLGFQYDNILMEEAGQVLDIETFIPMVLSKQEEENRPARRVKRMVLLGDHNQLPPVVKNIALQKYGHLDQSLFTRLVRLGVPTIELDYQGRARPTISKLYNWRYKRLLDLPSVQKDEFLLANAGLTFDYQLVDVEDYMGRGELEPNAYFYQNLGEAEYIVALYQYMRLIGYPASKITILTTYNGQKFLIRDVIEQRCAKNPFFGRPHKVTTVDRYQGQQNDYVLLSLVRTKTVGHIRDIRRLVVAMSRARLGLYVFCRRSLFENCYELTQTFSILLKRPSKLHLVQNESYPSARSSSDSDEPEKGSYVVDNVSAMMQLSATALNQAQLSYAAAQRELALNQTSATANPNSNPNSDSAAEETKEQDDETTTPMDS